MSIWAVATIAVWVVAWVTYWTAWELSACSDIFATAHGGTAHSVGWAGVIGLLLMLLAASFAFRWRRRFLLLFAAFVTLDVVGLLALWAASPAIWGQATCAGG